MKFAWIFIAAAVVAGCTGGGDTTTTAPSAPPAVAPAAAPGSAPAAKGGGGAQANIVAPHVKADGAMEKLAIHDKAMKEAALHATGFASVQAVFTTNCVKCHSGPKPKYKLTLASYDGVMKGGSEGPVVVAADPSASILDKALHGKGAKQMPPSGPLSDGDIKKIEDWIKAGAKNS